MTGAVLALRVAIRSALIADPVLTALLGGPHVHDEAPRDAAPPYATFGPARMRDWSTSSDEGAEHQVDLDLWGGPDTPAPCLAAAERARIVLHEAPLVLDGHRLVDLRFVSMETRRERNGRVFRVTLRFRSVTEQL